MPEWLADTRKDFADFVKGSDIKDPILRALTDLEQSLTKAWTGNRCLVCPIGELAALAAATKTLYLEQRRRQ